MNMSQIIGEANETVEDPRFLFSPATIDQRNNQPVNLSNEPVNLSTNQPVNLSMNNNGQYYQTPNMQVSATDLLVQTTLVCAPSRTSSSAFRPLSARPPVRRVRPEGIPDRP